MKILLACLATVFTIACVRPYDPPDWIQGRWSTDPAASSNNRTDWRFTDDNIIRTLIVGGSQETTDFMELSGRYREDRGDDFYKLINPVSPDDREWGHLFSRRTDDALDWEETSSLGTSNEGPLYGIE